MTIDKVEITKDLVRQLTPIVDPITIIAEDQTENRPQGSYVTIEVTGLRQIGQEETKDTDNSGITTIETVYSLNVRFTGVNDPTATPIGKLNFSILNDPITIDNLNAAGFAILTNEAFIQNDPQFRNGKWEKDHTFFIDCHYVDTNTVDTSYIGTVEITGKFYNPGTQTEDYPTTDPTYTTTITIPDS